MCVQSLRLFLREIQPLRDRVGDLKGVPLTVNPKLAEIKWERPALTCIFDACLVSHMIGNGSHEIVFHCGLVYRTYSMIRDIHINDLSIPSLASWP